MNITPSKKFYFEQQRKHNQRRVSSALPCLLLASLLLTTPNVTQARQTIVVGTLGVGYDFWERTYDTEDSAEVDADSIPTADDHSGDKRQWGAWPKISIDSRGIHDTWTLNYAPVLMYDELDSATDLDHYLTLNGQYDLKQHWSVSLANNFVLSDDPGRYTTPFYSTGQTSQQPSEESQQTSQESDPDPSNELTKNQGRRRYWTNDFSLQTNYTYAVNSIAGIGYTNRLLRNDSSNDADTDGYDEYDKHDFLALLSYQFAPSWAIDTEFHYIKGLYDDDQDTIVDSATQELTGTTQNASPSSPLSTSQDLQEYHARLRLDYIQSIHDTFPVVYSFKGTEYDSDLRQNTWAHELTLGWDHAFDKQTHFIIGGGPSYVNSEDLEGEWDYNFYLKFNKSYQHASLNILLDKRYETKNFTGSRAENGLNDSTGARADFSYRFTQNLTTTIFAQYQHILTVDPQGESLLANATIEEALTEEKVGDITSTRQTYSAGASLNYTFWRSYVATCRYEYFKQDGDLDRNSYNDHRLSLLFSVNYDFWP